MNDYFDTIREQKEILKAIREYRDLMKDEPDSYVKLSKIYHDLGRMLGEE